LKFFTNVRVVKSSAFCLFYRPAFFIKSLAIVLEAGWVIIWVTS